MRKFGIRSILNGRRYLPDAVVTVLSAVAVFAMNAPLFLSRYAADGDTLMQFYHFHKLSEPNLFMKDLIASYLIRYLPLGMSAIYSTAATIMDLKSAVAIIPSILFVGTAVIVFRIGRHVGGSRGGIAAWAMFCVISSVDLSFATASMRSFGFPLTFGFVSAVLLNRVVVAGLCLLGFAWLYPVALPGPLFFYVIWLVVKVDRRELRRVSLATAGLVIVGSLLGPMIYGENFRCSGCDHLYSYESLMTMPETNVGGRYPIGSVLGFRAADWIPIAWLQREFFFERYDSEQWNLGGWSAFISIALIIWNVGRFGRCSGDVTRKSAIVGILFHMGVLIFLYHFGFLSLRLAVFWMIAAAAIFSITISSSLPKHELRLSLAIILCSLGVYALFRFGTALFGISFSEPAKQLRYVVPTVMIVLAIPFVSDVVRRSRLMVGVLSFAVLMTFTAALRIEHFRKPLISEIIDAAAVLPPTVILAGPPSEMDFVPFFAKRQVWVSEEHSWPVFENLWSEYRLRTETLFKVYYSSSEQEVSDFCAQNRDVVLVPVKYYYSEDYMESGRTYFKPFDTLIRERYKRNANYGFAVVRLVEDAPEWTSLGYAFLSCMTLLSKELPSELL